MLNKKDYELFGRMNPDKFMDFIVDFFEKMGMKNQELPISCSYCPLKEECGKVYESGEELTCLEFLALQLSDEKEKEFIYENH